MQLIEKIDPKARYELDKCAKKMLFAPNDKEYASAVRDFIVVFLNNGYSLNRDYTLSREGME